MPLQQKLQVKLSQRLILTPSLQQAIKLLPMTTVELLEMLNQEVVENPLLEVSSEEVQQTEKTDADVESATEGQDSWDDNDYEYFFGDYLDNGYRPSMPVQSSDFSPIESTLSKPSSLSDHLMWQLSAFTEEKRLREIGVAIIGNLDDDGYLVASIEEISEMGAWGEEEVESVLSLIQGFDPVGIAARELRECLLLQLRHLGLQNTPSELIVREHLQLLESNQVSATLARQLGLPSEEIKDYVEIIRRLDPKPGTRYGSTQSQYVTPDVHVVKVDNQYIARVNEDGLPQLRISPVYRRLLDKNNQNSAETRSYVKEKFRSALWLIKSVDQRQKTIQKVATSIIRFQSEFLDYGIEYLRPLVLRDVATDIGMHESTVSRVVNNKYMHTPQGVFEMKFFFHSRIHTAYGENVSSVTIKQRIKNIIDSEDSRKPFSDSRIVALLQEQGLVMARRTIAKYREQLRIPTSSNRRLRD